MDAFRSALQPVTHNLPTPIYQLGNNLLGPVCYKHLILDIDPLNYPDCVKLAVSKGLGVGIIGASSIVKIPQLLKLINSQSASGVSFLSYLLETTSFLITFAYNIRQGNPFSTFGETALIALQNVVISTLVLHYSGKDTGAAVFVAGLAGGLFALLKPEVVDGALLTKLQAGAGVLGVGSKLPQILAIYREGGTGQLSAFAVFNYLAGSLSRIFTTLQEVDDPLILYGFIAGFILNLVLALQMIYYWNAPPDKVNVPQGKITGKQGVPVIVSSSETKSSAQKGPTTRRRG